MKWALLIFLFLANPLWALRIDPNASSFDEREKKRLDTYDFSGDFPKLNNIDIDGRRKINVELLLTGNYPLLEKINYEGGFGTIKGNITGKFPKLEEITITCTTATLNLNLDAPWEKKCTIFIAGKGDITLTLPQNTPLCVAVSSGLLKGVQNNHPTLVQKRRGITKRFFITPNSPEEERLLTIEVASEEGTITFQ